MLLLVLLLLLLLLFCTLGLFCDGFTTSATLLLYLEMEGGERDKERRKMGIGEKMEREKGRGERQRRERERGRERRGSKACPVKPGGERCIERR